MRFKITWVIVWLTLTNCGMLWAQEAEKIELAQQYDDKGEVEKAKSLYDELVRKKDNVPLVHARYLRLLLNNDYASEAEKSTSSTLLKS